MDDEAPDIEFLNKAFDRPEFWKLPAQQRVPVTRELEALFDSLIDVVQPSRCLEVGAFEGDFSIRVKQRFPEAEVVAFEANPRVFATFNHKMADAGVDYRHLAVGSTDGVAQIHIPVRIADSPMPEVNRMASLRTVSVKGSETEMVEVPTSTLDDAIPGNDDGSTVLWIDVEGAVDQVLAGAAKTLEQTALLLCEVETKAIWADQVLSDWVYRSMNEAGFTAVSRDCQKSFQHNALFVRNDLLKNPTVTATVARHNTQLLEIWDPIRVDFLAPKSRPSAHGDISRSDELARLRADNARLEAELRRARARLAKRSARKAETSAAAATEERQALQDVRWLVNRLNNSPLGVILRRKQGFRKLLDRYRA